MQDRRAGFFAASVLRPRRFCALSDLGTATVGAASSLCESWPAASTAARPRRRAPRPAAASSSSAASAALARLCSCGLFVEQGLTVGDRDLVVVGVNFSKGEEAVSVAAVIDEGRLKRRLHARDLGEINIAP